MRLGGWKSPAMPARYVATAAALMRHPLPTTQLRPATVDVPGMYRENELANNGSFCHTSRTKWRHKRPQKPEFS